MYFPQYYEYCAKLIILPNYVILRKTTLFEQIGALRGLVKTPFFVENQIFCHKQNISIFKILKRKDEVLKPRVS